MAGAINPPVEAPGVRGGEARGGLADEAPLGRAAWKPERLAIVDLDHHSV